jgi:hypothetical protein
VVLQEKQLTAYKSTKETVDSLQDVGGLADKVLPEEQEQSLTVAELSAFAQRASLGIKDLTFTEPPVEAKGAKKKTKQKSAIPKNVTVTPSPLHLKKTLDTIISLISCASVEENQRKMQITNIALTPNETDRTLLEEVSVSINLYVKAAKTSATEKK